MNFYFFSSKHILCLIHVLVFPPSKINIFWHQFSHAIQCAGFRTTQILRVWKNLERLKNEQRITTPHHNATFFFHHNATFVCHLQHKKLPTTYLLYRLITCHLLLLNCQTCTTSKSQNVGHEMAHNLTILSKQNT